MEKEQLFDIFTAYARQFYTGEAFVDRNQDLKVQHTMRVVQEASDLAEAECFSADETGLLIRAALFHDISRFEQFKKYRTFDDRCSFDHGQRSFEILQEQPLLEEDLSDEERGVILDAVRYHNKIGMPAQLSDTAKKILMAVRDSDKTDIMGILIQHLKNPDNSAIVYKLSDNGILSDRVRDSVLAGRLPENDMLESSLDFIAAKFAWGFDLNYRWTCRTFLERNCMQQIRELLPEEPHDLDLMLENVLTHLKERVM